MLVTSITKLANLLKITKHLGAVTQRLRQAFPHVAYLISTYPLATQPRNTGLRREATAAGAADIQT